jgi:PAS domain S-box-containing protein
MAEHIQEVFWLSSADCQQLLYVSPAFETVWDRPIESLYVYPGGHLNLIVDSIHPSDRERVVAAIANFLQDEYKAEYRIVRPDGSIRWVRSHSFPIQNPFGETWGLAGLSTDITECKQADELLQQREQEFRALVEHSPDMIFRLDRELRYVYVNPTVERERGKPPQAYLGKTLYEMGMPEAVVSVWEQSSQKIFQTGEEDRVEFSCLTPNGLRYYQSRVVPEFAADGSVEFILGINRDITKNKQMEERLRESEERFRTVFEFAPIGMATCNSQGRLLQSNQAFQEILGYTGEELQNLSYREIIHPDDVAMSVKLFQELLTGKRHHFSLENRYFRKDGRVVWGNVAVSAIYDAKGLFQYAIAMIQDISDRKHSELDLSKAHSELEKRVAERTAELDQTNKFLKQEITERKLLTEALKAQRDFLQTVIDTNPSKIFVKDTQSKTLLANQACADFYGTTVEELLGKTPVETNPNQADVEQFIAQDREVITTLQQISFLEDPVRTPTGEVRWFQTIKKPLLASDGQVSLILGVSTDITERKLAEEKLRQSEEQLRLALDAARMGNWNWNLQTGEITRSNNLELLFGWTPNTCDSTYESFLAILHPEDRARVQQADQCAIETGEDRDIEFRILLPDGSIRWIQSKSKVFYDEMGSPVRMIGISLDISDRKFAEEELRRSEEQLRLALDAARMGFWNCNLQTGIITWSNNLEQLFGLAPNTFDGKFETFLAMVHPQDRERIDQATEHSIESRQRSDIEFRIVLPDGTIRWMQSKGQVFYDETGSPVRATGINLDISDRKHSEEQLQRSQEQLRLALEAARMGCWDWDLTTGVVTRSKSLEQLLGFSADTAEHNNNNAFLARVHPEDREFVNRADRRSIETGEDYCIEFRIIWPDESVHWIESKGQVFVDETGKPARITGIDIDITERKLAEIQIKEALREKEVLLQEIHHRVKNNLQVVSSLLDLQSQYIEAEAMQEVFRESCNRVKSMALVHEKLYQSQDLARINFADYIEHLISYLFQAYGVNPDHITLSLNIDDIKLNINTAIPCGLIINELVSNALKYAFTNRPKGTITIQLHADLDKRFTLLVRDNGVGLPMNWDFNSVQSLGLQLVNVLTNQLEGTLEVGRSVGTEFRINFCELSP